MYVMECVLAKTCEQIAEICMQLKSREDPAHRKLPKQRIRQGKALYPLGNYSLITESVTLKVCPCSPYIPAR